MHSHQCFDGRTNVSYPGHEFIGGECTRCGEPDPDMTEDSQTNLADLYRSTLADGGCEQDGVPVPYASTAYTADGTPVVRRLSHGYEIA